MARFLVDESLPRAVTRALVATKHEAADARDVGLRGRPDSEVHARAVAENRIVVAADLDFANALRFPPGTHPGILVLRVPDSWGAQARAERVAEAIGNMTQEELAGAIVIVEPGSVRVYRTPR